MAISSGALRAAVAYNKRRLGPWAGNTFARNVWAFQTAYGQGLTIDGKLGPNTQRKVAEAANASAFRVPLAKTFALSIQDQLATRRADPAAAREAAHSVSVRRQTPAPRPPAPRPAPRPPAGVRPPAGQLTLIQSENAREANAVAAKEYGIKITAPYTGASDSRLAADVYALQRAEAIDAHAPGIITPNVAKRLKQLSGKDVGGNPAAMRLSQGVSFPMSLMKIGGVALGLAAIGAFAYTRMAGGKTVPQEQLESDDELMVLTPDEYAAAEVESENVIPASRANPYSFLDDSDGEDDVEDNDYDGEDEDDYEDEDVEVIELGE